MTVRSPLAISLPCDLASVTVGRHFVRDVLSAWHLPRLVDDAQLATSELVANGVRHAGTDLMLSVNLGDGVVIAIGDSRPEIRRPVLAGPGSMAERGRGLHIVAAVSSDWGIRATPTGKEVWFALVIPDGPGMADAMPFAVRHHLVRTVDRPLLAVQVDRPGRPCEDRRHPQAAPDGADGADRPS